MNFHVGFLRPDGERNPDTPLDLIADHVDYLVARLGPDKVGFGSDFDGATIPAELGDAAGLPRLVDALRAAGFTEEELERVRWGNWRRVLGACWR